MSQQLYRFYDEAGTLLYVGITLDPPTRFRSHSGAKDWWDRVKDIRLESYPDRGTALDAERETIKRERPHYNVIHNLPDPLAGSTIRQLQWTCEECGERIGKGQGYIYVKWSELFEVGDRRRQREQMTPEERVEASVVGLGSFSLPVHARWHVLHRQCDPEPDADGYWIAIERMFTVSQMFRWVAHLSQKNWLQDTDFDALMYRLASVTAENKA